ncbi:MAG TPA: ABC transporter substrate-binding protein [Bacteriovoracaceae bacterium]|nr:ABC transporter substrate-binding protein [Bacteriovoracaceae bacterium]
MRIFILALLLVMTNCTQISPRKTIDESQISPISKAALDAARSHVKGQEPQLALDELARLDDSSLSPVEMALKYNLRGVILFNLNEIDAALMSFEVAEKNAPKTTHLYSQVQLNLASIYFRLGEFDRLDSSIKKVELDSLSPEERKKYGQLVLAYGSKNESAYLVTSAVLLLLEDVKSMDEVRSSKLFSNMTEAWTKLTEKEKIKILDRFEKTENAALAILAQNEAESRYINGDKRGAQDVIKWLSSEFKTNEEVKRFVKDFEFRLESSSRMIGSHVGLVLPLSGKYASFGQKALSGVDTGLKKLADGNKITIFTKDSMNSPAQGAQAILDLIRENRVSFIIGGLFPETAKSEYLEARKYGVLYISLSQINLPKEEKNHHLIEIQGSIESQVEALVSDQMIKTFGNRIGVIFPDDEGGKAYIDEIWRKGAEKGLKISSIASFPKSTHDYRDAVKLFLGLEYPRERSEELELLQDVYSAERSSIRRVQTLPPVIDFDWVFLASYPHQATQLIPTLSYFDAKKLKIVGGPSWVYNTMVKEQRKLGTLYFVGDDPEEANQSMLDNYKELYGRTPSITEVLALDAMILGHDIVKSSMNSSDRDSLDQNLKKQGKLNGLSTYWTFSDGIWIKKMNSMIITRGQVRRLFN